MWEEQGTLRQQLASPALERYAASGTLPIHNNLVEKVIRSMVIGKFKLNTLLRWRGCRLQKKQRYALLLCFYGRSLLTGYHWHGAAFGDPVY